MKKKEQNPLAREHDSREKLLYSQTEIMAKTGSWELDLETNELYWSDGVYHMLGYAPQAFVVDFNRGLSVIHPEDQERAVAEMQQAIETGKDYNIQKRFITVKGKISHIRSLGKVLKDEAGKPYKLIGIFQDISEQVEAFQALEQEKELNENLIQLLPNVFCIFNEAGKFLLWNKTFEQVSGYTAAEIAVKNPLDFFPAKNRSAVSQQITEVFQHGVVQTEMTLINKAQNELPFNVSARTIHFKGENCLCCIGVDISQTKEALLEISLMLNSTEESFVLLNKQLNIVSFNKQFQFFYQDIFAREIAKGSSILDYALDGQRERLQQLYFSVLDGNTINRELILPTPEGERVFSLRYAPARDDNDHIVGAFVTALEITKQHRATASLKTRENELQQILDSSLDVICILDANGIFKKVSEASFQVWGYKPEELVGKPFTDIIHPDDVERSTPPYVQISEDGALSLIQNRYIHKAGHEVEMLWSARVRDGKTFAVARDITEIRKNELLLQANEARFRALVEYGADAIAILGPDGKPTYVSPSITQVLGYSEAEALELNLFEILHPDDVAGVSERMQEVMEKPGIAIPGYTSRTKHKDGSWRWLEATITNMLHVPGINGIVDNFRDVTEQIETDRKLALSEKRYKALVQEGSDLTAILNPEGNYVYVSPSYPILVGHEVAELIGKSGFTHVHPDDVADIKATFERVFVEKRVRTRPYRYHRKDGSWCWIQTSCNNLLEEEGVNGIVINCVDITDLLHYQNTLQASNERYDLVNQATNDAIYDWDVVNDHFEWGAGFERNFGYTSSGKPFRLQDWVRMMDQRDAEAKKQLWEAFMHDKSRNRWNNEFRLHKADGSLAFVEEIGHLIRDHKGKPQRMIGVLRDQTESKIEQLRQNVEHDLAGYFSAGKNLGEALEEMLKYLANFGSFNLAEIWLMNLDQSQLNLSAYYGNDKLKKLFYGKNHFKKAAKGEGLPGLVWSAQQSLLWDVIDKHPDFKRQDLARAADLVSASGIPLYNQEELVGVLVLHSTKNVSAVSFDVQLLSGLSDTLAKEIQRKKQEDELHLLFNSAPDIMAIATQFGHFTKVNPAFCNLLGYSAEELTTHPFSYFLHPDDLRGTTEEYAETIQANKRQTTNFINRYRTKSGSYKWISWSSSALFGEDGLAFAYGRDISEIKALEQLLENAANLARIGSWEIDLRQPETPQVYWSPMTRQILGVDERHLSDIEGGLLLYEKESRQKLALALEELQNTGEKFDLELLVITPAGQPQWVRCIGDSQRIGDRCIRMYGSFQDIHNRKTTELELLQFKKIIENSRDGIAMADNRGRAMYMNSGFSTMLGYLPEELEEIGGPMAVYADQKQAESVFGTLLRGEYWKGDIELINKKGEAISYFLSAGPVLNANNELVAIYGIHTDISERKAAELALQQAFIEKNTILESIGDGFFTLDRDWTVTYWNNRAEEILGKKKEEMLGNNLWDVFSDAIAMDFYRQYHHAMENRVTTIFEDYYPTLKLWVEISAYPSETGLSVYFKDISQRKQAEASIYEANERFEKATLATNDAIWDWDLKTNGFYWGNGYATLFGYDPKKLEKEISSWSDLIHPQDLPSVMASIHEVIASKTENNWQHEYRYLKSDGNFAFVVDRGIVIRDENGEALRMVGAMTDITLRKAQEESLIQLNLQLAKHARELEISNAELEQFAYVASHDLQEPLRMITSFLSQLDKKYHDKLDEKAHKYIYFAVDGAKRMRQIILDLLEFSRVGRLEEEQVNVSLSQLIDDYKLLRNKLITEYKAEILYSHLPDLPTYKAPLTQVFHNLLDNAIKYSRAGVSPKIVISAEEKTSCWEFKVQDNGIGIEADYFDKIFVIFQRLHPKDAFEGTGMGLAIVKKVIKNLQGEIWLESEPGQGTTFYFTLPK